ncbi:MAG: putative pfkB family carbohydrate kinase [Candidatus Saccharibacteria bacterium]|nr:putative pfkB family carbohydrate kinase [Candidatus Saccharibacteria bacterium]
MKVAVVGHLEWATFSKVDHVPVAGEIIHTHSSWEEVAGGGAVAAMQLAALADNCLFFTAVGNDEHGRQAIADLRAKGVEVYASSTAEVPTRTIFVDIDANNERTITVNGNLVPSGQDATLPWEKLAEADAVYFVSGDGAALVAARQAAVLVSTARVLPLLQQSAIPLDALVASSQDAGEHYEPGRLEPVPTLIVTTDGSDGGKTASGETYKAEFIPPDKFIDTYGCGDSFAAGLTLGLGQNLVVSEALKLAAHCGAQAAMRRGAFQSH